MKAFGFNAVRCSHNPYSEEFLDLADELGLLVVDEVADKWSGDVGVGRPFINRFFPLVTEWVRRDRNRPSVILWSLGNELQQNELAAGFQTDPGEGEISFDADGLQPAKLAVTLQNDK